ncbi:MAG TPA: radical SAM protein [Sandaracinaceae bacterium LLY-WYZ-13_1]|nr:radical SAM protein [Sandaracinaceae bacterium LLY-WYZ-13_1]
MVELVQSHASEQNRRFAVRLEDGATVEAVLYREDSLCVSCQVGCAVGCPFCASGANGLARPLSFEELVGQVEAVRALGAPLRRVTVSGVGEPLHNRHVLDFVRWCREARLAPSLTTSGGPLERLRALIHAHHNGVTVSVHAGTEATRAAAVPRGPALSPLFEALAEEVPRLSRSRQRKIALAYLLVAGLNDADAEVDAFVARARPLGLWTHLYAYNPVPTSEHAPVDRARYDAIYRRMSGAGLRVRMSCRARVEPNGGCGTLVALRPSRRVDTPTAAVR